MSDSPLTKAREFLHHQGLYAPDASPSIIFFNNSFYVYDEKKWITRTTDDLEDDVIKLALAKVDFLSRTSDRIVRDIVRNVRAITKKNDLKIGQLINNQPTEPFYYIPLQNGILKLSFKKKSLCYELEPTTKNLFNTYLLPYEFNSSSVCERFQCFLKDVLNAEEIQLLQEWFGYCLIPVNLANKFMIFYGLGANGKSVILLVLKLVLGEENVSCIPLQSFLPESRFGLAATEGKLANIAEEIDENINAASGLLKQFTGGDAVPVERKYKEGFLITPTASLTFATNDLPKFNDLSDGITRRMIILPFSKQFLDESKQDKDLINKDFWRASGELSGIFNWALKGLERLISNNWKFTEPQTVTAVMENYKTTINPAIQFLRDYLDFSPEGQITVVELYQRYAEHCKTFGILKAESSAFGRNVRKVFPHATQSPNALTMGKIRTRVWYGLKFKNDDYFEPETSETQVAQKYQEKTSFQEIGTDQKEVL